MELPVEHPAIDAFKGHSWREIEDLLNENHLLPVLIPSSCTDRLQPVDVSMNKPLKARSSAQQLHKMVCIASTRTA